MSEQLEFDFINKSFDDMKFDYLHRRIGELNAQVERLHSLLANSVSCCKKKDIEDCIGDEL